MDCSPPVFSVHWIFQARNPGVGCQFLLQGTFLTHGLNPSFLGSLHWQVDSLPLCPLGSPYTRRLTMTISLLWKVKWKSLSGVRLLVTPWTIQARTLEWVAIPFSRGSSQPRDGTQVSYITGRFFAIWATREAHMCFRSVTKDSLLFIAISKVSSFLPHFLSPSSQKAVKRGPNNDCTVDCITGKNTELMEASIL